MICRMLRSSRALADLGGSFLGRRDSRSPATSRENIGEGSGSRLRGSGAPGTTGRPASVRETGQRRTADLWRGRRRPGSEGAGPIATAITENRRHPGRRVTATGAPGRLGARPATWWKATGKGVVGLRSTLGSVTQTSTTMLPRSLHAAGGRVPLHRGWGAERPTMVGTDIPTPTAPVRVGYGTPGRDGIAGGATGVSTASGAGTRLPGTRGSVILGWDRTGDWAAVPCIVDIFRQADDNGSR
jgi:hypothetical protein